MYLLNKRKINAKRVAYGNQSCKKELYAEIWRTNFLEQLKWMVNSGSYFASRNGNIIFSYQFPRTSSQARANP
jgi:hypothetical protein